MAKVGRPRNLNSPNELWVLFQEYKADTKANPRTRHVFVGKDGNSDFEQLERPLTIEGFKEYCYDIVGSIKQYLLNEKGAYEEYSTICTRIIENIRKDQIEGGMVGQYNASITQRLNNLSDSQDLTVKQEPRVFEIRK